MCLFVLQGGVCRVAEEPFRCRNTGFPVVWERLFYGAERAFPLCGRMVVASRYCEECPPEWFLWRCGGYGGAGEDGINACPERFLFSLLKEKKCNDFLLSLLHKYSFSGNAALLCFHIRISVPRARPDVL